MDRKMVSAVMLTLFLTNILTLAFSASASAVMQGTINLANQESPPTEWNKTYGGTKDDYAWALVQTNDGGYALTGSTNSYSDSWLVKTDANGDIHWNKTYGGTGDDETYALVQTSDGGYALAGLTTSFGVGNMVPWLVKTDATGSMQWNKTYGGTSNDAAYSVVQTSDGGYALAGLTRSFGAGSTDFWLVKTDAAGSMQWNKTYGGTGDDEANALVQTGDGGYALAGYTDSFGAGSRDFWLVKIGPEGLVPDFSISAYPTSLIILQGRSDISQVTVTSANGFSQPVQLAISGAPSGVTTTIDPEQVTPPTDSSATSNLTFSISATATLGSFRLIVTGTNGTITHRADINLEIKALSPEWTFAILTDLHIGRGYAEYNGEEYYLTQRLRNTVKWINDNKNRFNIKFVAVLGDISDSGELSELKKAKDILDGLNDDVPYIPVIGNHDIWAYTDSQEWPDLRYFGAVFKPQYEKLEKNPLFNLRKQTNPIPTDLENYAFIFNGIEFVILDCASRERAFLGLGKGVNPGAVLYPRTVQWLNDTFSEGKPTILFSHHPMVQKKFLGTVDYGFRFEDLTSIEESILWAEYSYGTKVLGDFAGHIHGFYNDQLHWIPEYNPNFMDADMNYTENTYTPAGISVLTTEALMVGSNEDAQKGIIRIVTASGSGILGASVDGEFPALNPYLKMETDKLKVDFEAYAFTTRFTRDRPLRYILDYGDGSIPEEIDSSEINTVEFNHTYDLKSEMTRSYKVKLSVVGYTPDGNETIESIAHELTLNAPSRCFIFTAVLGTQAVQDLKYMRLFRDNVLLLTPLGHAFVDVYYMASPPIAEVISHNEILRIATRTFFVMPALYFSEAIFSPLSPLQLLALVPTTLLLYKKRKITIFLNVLGQGMLISGSILSLVFILGILANTWPVCAVAAAILLPTALPLASVPFARKTIGARARMLRPAERLMNRLT